MKYEILEHTGDAKIHAFGRTKEELFLNAMLGMNVILNSKVKSQKSKMRKIALQSNDINSLLVDFLNEVNYLRQVNMEVYDDIKLTRFSDTHSAGSGQAELKGELSGYAVEEFGEDVKAVTFHGLDIGQNKKGVWEATIVFDV